MKLVIIIPAYNEEKFLPKTLDAIVAQSRKPDELIVVNDNSSDATPAIVSNYHSNYPWIKLVHTDQAAHHAPGAKVVNAFYQGFQQISIPDWEVVFKLDADIELPSVYCESILHYFKQDPQIGMAGGILEIPHEDGWKQEAIGNLDHLRGALKAYRRACFDQMNGIRRAMGWDTADELLARYYGWKVVVDPTLVGRHYRVTGKQTGALKVQTKIGKALYSMRYGPGITFLSSLKTGMSQSPKVLSGTYLLLGFFQAWIKNQAFIVDPDQGKFIRNYRWKGMKEKVSQVFGR